MENRTKFRHGIIQGQGRTAKETNMKCLELQYLSEEVDNVQLHFWWLLTRKYVHGQTSRGFAANRRASYVDMFKPGAVTQKPAVYSSLSPSSVCYIALRCVGAEFRCIIHWAPESGIALPQSLQRLIYLLVALWCVIYYLKTVSAPSDLGLRIFLRKQSSNLHIVVYMVIIVFMLIL